MVTGLVSDFHTIIVIAPSILKHLHDLSKIAMCADVFIFFWFLVVVLNGGTPWGWLAMGVKGVFCYSWELLVGTEH